MGAILQQPVMQVPTIYNFKNELLCVLSECLEINEQLRFGDISQLTFEYPIFQVDQYNGVRYDSNGKPIINPKCQYIVNDNRVYFNGKWYIIKINEDSRDETDRLTIRCTCNEIGYLLQEGIVQSLRIIPPIDTPVNARTALFYTVMAMQTERTSMVVSASGTSVVLDANAEPTDSIYNTYSIYIKRGTGAGQSREIVSYNGTSKTIVVDSAFSPQLDATSEYIVWNSTWRIGTVDAKYNTDLRSHEFDFVNGWDALQQVRDKYLDANDDVGNLTFSSAYYPSIGRWINYVNLVSADNYNSVDIRYRKNMKSMLRRMESDKTYTRVIPSGVDNLTVGSIASESRTDGSVTYYTHINGYNHIDNFRYYLAQGYTYKECRDNFVKVYRFDDARYTDATTLYNDSKKLLEKASIPKYTYIASALDLSKLAGRSYESFTIGNTLRIVDEDLGIDIYATVSYIDRNWSAPQNAQIELTNYVDNMGDILKRIIGKNNEYSNLKSIYGNTATYIIADKSTSKNWRQADYVVQENESASLLLYNLINSIDETKGARIILLDGTYYFNNSVYLKSNITIEGQGGSTKLISKIPVVGFYISGGVGNLKNNVSVKNLKMYGFTANIEMLYCKNTLVDSLISENCSGIYINIENSDDVKIYNNVLGTSGQKYGSSGIYLSSNVNVNIKNNTLYGSTNQIIVFSALGEMNITNNYIEYSSSTNSGNAIFIGSASMPTAGWENSVQLFNINILDNTLKLNGNQRGIDIINSRNIRMEKNKINGGKDIGIRLTTCLDGRIMENTIISDTSAYTGIDITGSTVVYSGRIEAQGNIIQNPTGAKGIELNSTVQSSFITNNNLTNSCTNPAVNGLILNGNTPTTSAGNRF